MTVTIINQNNKWWISQEGVDIYQREKPKNSEYYKHVMVELVARATKRNEKFSFSIQQIRSKFKRCMSDCKKVAFTIKTATGIKRFQDEKGYGRWFDQLYPVIKSRDSCQMERAFEPSAPDWNQLPKEQQEDEEAQPVCSTKQFIPVKHKGKAKKKDDSDNFNSHVLKLIEKTIENDPTKGIVNFLTDEMERSRQHELQLLRLLTDQTVNHTPGSYGNVAVPSKMYGNMVPSTPGPASSGSYGNAAVPSQMYGSTVPNSPGFPLHPSYMYQAEYPPLHQGQSYPDSQNV